MVIVHLHQLYRRDYGDGRGDSDRFSEQEDMVLYLDHFHKPTIPQNIAPLPAHRDHAPCGDG